MLLSTCLATTASLHHTCTTGWKQFHDVLLHCVIKSGGKRESQRGSVILAARLQNSSGHCSNILPVKRVMCLCQSVLLSGRIPLSI